MLIKLENPVLLAKAIDIMSELVVEVKLKINSSGMGITAIDPANVAMVSFKIPKEAFAQFEVKDDALGINLDSLKRILKRCGSNSTLFLEQKDNTLVINIHDRIKRSFVLSLIDIEKEDKEMPDLDYNSRVKLNSADLVDSIEDCIVVSDACSFIIKDGKFVIESKALNSARSEFSSDEAEIIAQDCKSRYSLEYLQKFLKGAKLSDKTTLKFSESHPLRMDVKAENLELSFILAPRVETVD